MEILNQLFKMDDIFSISALLQMRQIRMKLIQIVWLDKMNFFIDFFCKSNRLNESISKMYPIFVEMFITFGP